MVHDTDGSGTDQFTRTLDESALTFLTTSVLVGDTSIIVANGAAITSFPTDVWVNRECMHVTASAGNTLFVTRGYYGTAAEAIEVDAAQALQPELFAYPCTLRGRGAPLSRERYHGDAAVDRIREERPDRRCERRFVSSSSARTRGSKKRRACGATRASATSHRIRLGGDLVRGRERRQESDRVQHPAHVQGLRLYGQAGSDERRAFARQAATDSLGATSVFYTATDTGGEMLVVLRFGTFTLGARRCAMAAEYTATSSDNSGVREHVWRIAVPDRGALVRTGFALGGDDRATVIRPHVGLTRRVGQRSQRSRSGVSITPVLVGELRGRRAARARPHGAEHAGAVTNDATFTSLAGDAMQARSPSGVRSRDPTRSDRAPSRSRGRRTAQDCRSPRHCRSTRRCASTRSTGSMPADPCSRTTPTRQRQRLAQLVVERVRRSDRLRATTSDR